MNQLTSGLVLLHRLHLVIALGVILGVSVHLTPPVSDLPFRFDFEAQMTLEPGSLGCSSMNPGDTVQTK